ncbi:MAG: hypothetical protein HQM15_10535 [Deltaproteobacteria bacterium]|nr:hypothetical protein [Deltaproteobacteria bacterium]
MPSEIEHLKTQLKIALAECEHLRTENKVLRAQFQKPVETPSIKIEDDFISGKTFQANEKTSLSLEQKVFLFRSLFRGREDVYALRWEGKEGKKGYSPACVHDWNCPSCSHNRKMRARCENRKFIALTDEAIHDHLSGKHTVGLYPLLIDESCYFLAADFDKENWLEDTKSFIQVCKEHEIDCLLERSRSGKGGHIWIFFENPIAASLVRRLGSFLLTKTMEKRHQVVRNRKTGTQ